MAYERDNNSGGYGGGFETGMGRQRARRPQTDYGTSYLQFMRSRRRDRTIGEMERSSSSYIIDILPPAARRTRPVDTIPVKHLHSSLNKAKHPINIVRWTPEGRRLLTGSSSGEFTLWNGMGFNFETIMQAHDSAIRAATWSHSDDWLISADHDGILKYWQPNFNNVKAIRAHELAIRELAFSPSDVKFASASDDSTIKIWDFAAGVEESTLTGHGWDAKTVDWHPSKGLLVSGSKDHQVKLWDPRNGRCLTTLHGHKSPISKTAFEPSIGMLLATCAKDQTARIFDIRLMRDVLLLRGHDRDITTLCWHPVHSSLLSTAGIDGSLYHYLLDEPNLPIETAITNSPYNNPDPSDAPLQMIFPAHRINYAHESAIWSLAWHPLGHILASGSNDRVTRFWSRPRPGDFDCFNDRYHLGEAGAEAHGTWSHRHQRTQTKEEEDQQAEDEADGLEDQNVPTRQPILPGLPGFPAAPKKDGTSVGGPKLQTQRPITLSGPMNISTVPANFSNNQKLAADLLPDQAHMLDITKLAHLFSGNFPQIPHPLPPPPPSSGSNSHMNPFPPMQLQSFRGFTLSQNSSLAPNLSVNSDKTNLPISPQSSPGFNTGESQDGPAINTGSGIGSTSGGRRRAPLPSQQDSLREEMRKGKYRHSK